MKRIASILLMLAILFVLFSCEPCKGSKDVKKYLDNEFVVLEKYSTNLNVQPFYLYTAIVRIDLCQYIIIKKDRGQAFIIHKADCSSPLHSEKK